MNPTAKWLPREIGQPATRALVNAGYKNMSQIARAKDADLLALHGFGPKALRILRETIKKKSRA